MAVSDMDIGGPVKVVLDPMRSTLRWSRTFLYFVVLAEPEERTEMTIKGAGFRV